MTASRQARRALRCHAGEHLRLGSGRSGTLERVAVLVDQPRHQHQVAQVLDLDPLGGGVQDLCDRSIFDDHRGGTDGVPHDDSAALNHLAHQNSASAYSHSDW